MSGSGSTPVPTQGAVGRFEGPDGHRRLVVLLLRSKLVGGDSALAARIADAGELTALTPGERLIVEGDDDSVLYLLLTGSVGIWVKGVRVNERGPGDHVGEVAAADPAQRRSATALIELEGVALALTEPQLHAVACDHPAIWRRLLVEANRRLVQRNALLRPANDSPKVFVICSREALDVAREVQVNLTHDDMLVTVWTDGVFRASEYPVEALVRAVDESDFAIAVVHGDDVVEQRGERVLGPRDNVTFELGLFMGHLGRDRTILLEPRGQEIRLASDLRGLTTLSYRSAPADALGTLLAPTCHEIRKHVARIGVRR